jgi:hypothetical protein
MSDEGVGIERVGFTQFTATRNGVQGVEDISALEGCEELVLELLRKINTRPGEDEEVLIQMIVRPKHHRGIRDAIQRRIDQ